MMFGIKMSKKNIYDASGHRTMQHAISVSVVLNEFDAAEDEGTTLDIFVYKRNTVAAKSTLGV